ncbi:MAG: trypsin-like peptidase domain-containing protein [Anaerolineales bacterium]|nr:trypsin-like peptidase domain-containing protein [Anaerolineales bacterium]
MRLVFHINGDEATATVEPGGWRDSGAEDVAILQLALPEGATPVPLGQSFGSANHPFETFGFPDANPVGGLLGSGQILGRTALNGVPVLQLRIQEVTGGFSGAPVWDAAARMVVGMVTATADLDGRWRLAETAFATPTETLVDVWPSLPISASFLVGHPLPSPHFGPSLSSPSIIPQEQISYVVPALLCSQFEHLAAQLSAETERHLEIMRTALREGRHEEAINWLVEIEADQSRWSVLSPEVKAKVLCFEASIVLDTSGDTNRARQLADQAHNFASTSNEIRVRAFITYFEGDLVAAIGSLEGQDDVDSLNLRAALLLEMNRINECWAILEQARTGNQPNAETLRIRALFHLATKDINQAQLEIQKALEFGARWRSIRFAAAVINYYSSLSPLALPARLVPWPEPVDWMLVKRDDESLSVCESLVGFQELAQTTQIAREEKHRFGAWRLACLATDPDCYEEANQYAQVLLQDAPTNFRVIAWIVARNLQVNLEPSRMTLEQLVTDGAAHVFHIVALASCYLVPQNVPEAVKLLDDTKTIFQEHQVEALWTFWYVQALVIQGETGAALEVINNSELKTELQHIQTMALAAKARESGNWQGLVQHLEDIYEVTGDANFLLELCEIMAQQHNWDYIADRAEILIKAVSTSETVRLIVIAAHNARRFKFCLELIDRHQHLFTQGKLPNQLRQIRIACQQALGLLPEAIVEAETLAREEPTVENLLALANLYLNKGDLKGLTIVARKLNNRTDLMPEPLLGLARLIQGEDQGLAISFWRKAISQELPDELVGEALALGFQLGLDDGVAPLMEKVVELGHQGKGGIQVKSVEDFIEFFEQRQEHTTKLDEIYRDGTGPIHLIAEQLGEPLVNFYHRFLIENATIKDPRRQFVLLARHGGRALLSGFPDSRPPWRLNLDITAILLAAHLDILTEIEETFRPLHIPAALIPALLRMRERVSLSQPSRLEIYRQIIDLQQRNMLAVVQCEVSPDYANPELVTELGEEWVALFEEVRTNSGYLVDYLPLHKRVSGDPPTVLPEDAAQYLVNCRGVVEALREQGPLSEEAYGDVIQALGTEGVVISDTVPTPGKLLYCYGNIPEVLAEANLLQLVCERFQVRVSQREFERVQKELKGYEQRRATAEWLDRLIDRLNRGVDDGTYAIIPTPPHEEGEMEERAAENPDVECLRTVLKFEATEGDVIWADDRWINSYLHRNGVPIIGINEILKSLVGAGTLMAGEYYQKLIKLRTANVRFIPVQTDEVIYHLRQARVENRRLVETQELEILRRSIQLVRNHR